MNPTMSNLDGLLDAIISNPTISSDDLFDLVFGDLKLSFSSKNQLFSDNVAKLASCFDLNGDGTFSYDDLEHFKSFDLSVLLNLTSAATYIAQLIAQLSRLNLNTDSSLNLTHRVLVYATLLPIATNSTSFRLWALQNNNKKLLVDSLNTLYNLICASSDVTSIVKNTLNLFKSKCKCSCFSSSVPISSTTFEDTVTFAVTQVAKVNKIHMATVRIAELETQVAALSTQTSSLINIPIVTQLVQVAEQTVDNTVVQAVQVAEQTVQVEEQTVDNTVVQAVQVAEQTVDNTVVQVVQVAEQTVQQTVQVAEQTVQQTVQVAEQTVQQTVQVAEQTVQVAEQTVQVAEQTVDNTVVQVVQVAEQTVQQTVDNTVVQAVQVAEQTVTTAKAPAPISVPPPT